jgi:diaminopimelate epimerase
MTLVTLSKLHATGNDFLVRTALAGEPALSEAQVVALCDRHRGIGADGVITLGPPRAGAQCSMQLVNADGGLAELSGNGLRCLAWVAARAGMAGDEQLTVDTDAGTKTVGLLRHGDGEVYEATVDMGPVTFVPSEIPVDVESPFGMRAEYHGVVYEGDAVGIGNPHFVLFVEDPWSSRVTTHGPRLERDPRFPNHTNVEFIAVDGRTAIDMRVWERGVGETLSCGTGACAAAAVAHRRELVESRVRVRVPGGGLTITLGDTVTLTGPVTHVFDVDVDADRLVHSGAGS